MECVFHCCCLLFIAGTVFGADTVSDLSDSCQPVVLTGAGQLCPGTRCSVHNDCQSGWLCCPITGPTCTGKRCVQYLSNNQDSRVAALQVEGSDNKSCPDILCLEECEYGHRRNSDNCVTCECNSRSTIRRDHRGCMAFTCDLFCGHRGYQFDSKGCKLCRCNTVWMPCPPATCPRDEDCTAEFVNEGGCIKCKCKCPTFNPQTDCPNNCPTKIVEGKYGCESCVCDTDYSVSTGRQVPPGNGWPLTNPWQIQTNPFQPQWPITRPISSPFVSNININPNNPVSRPYPTNTNTNPYLPNTNTNINSNTNPYLPNTNTNTNPFLPNTNSNTNPYLPNTNTNTNPFLPNTNSNTNPYLPNTNTNPFLPNSNTNTNPFIPNTNTNNNPFLPNTNTNPYNCPQSNCNILNCPYGIVQENDANNCVRCRCSLSKCQESGLICATGTTCQVIAGTPRCVNTSPNNNNQGVQCQSRPLCTIWCPNGYVLDTQGCPTCQCQTSSTGNEGPRCAVDSPARAECYVVRANPLTSNPNTLPQPTNPINPPPTWPFVDTSSCTQCSNQQQCRYGFLKDSNGCPICNGRCAQSSCDACYQNEICMPGTFSTTVTASVSCYSFSTGQTTQRQLSFANNYFTPESNSPPPSPIREESPICDPRCTEICPLGLKRDSVGCPICQCAQYSCDACWREEQCRSANALCFANNRILNCPQVECTNNAGRRFRRSLLDIRNPY